jgi:hypothetical protein
MTELASSLGSRVRTINLLTRNAGTFREEVRFVRDGIPTWVESSGSYAAIRAKVELDSGVWSVNEPDTIFFTKRPQKDPKSIGKWPLFVHGDWSHAAEQILRSKSFQELLSQLDLKNGDSLHIYRNGVIFYSKPTAVPTFLDRAAVFLEIVQELCNFAGVKEEAIGLPAAFGDLNDLAQLWAISDDNDRADAIEEASVEALEELVRRVEPRIGRIDIHLGKHDGDRDAALGCLAEAAAEAKIRLSGRIVRTGLTYPSEGGA